MTRKQHVSRIWRVGVVVLAVFGFLATGLYVTAYLFVATAHNKLIPVFPRRAICQIDPVSSPIRRRNRHARRRTFRPKHVVDPAAKPSADST